MPSVSLTGQDSAQINGINISTLADGNPFDIQFPNDLGAVKVGKNGNAIYAKNEMGIIANVTLRVLLGAVDDKYLDGLLHLWKADPSTFNLMTAMFNKRVGDGQGNFESKIYSMTGGFFRRQVPAKTSSESDTEQSVAVYELTFLADTSVQ